MNYSLYFKSLINEALSCKQYKKLNIAFKIFGFIGVFPFIAISAILSIIYNISVFFFNLGAIGVDYLENWLKNAKKDVKTPTEPVIYFLTIPTIFTMHVLLSLFSGSFFFLWFLMQCFFYIATLGGIRWQPYITKIDLDENHENYVATTNRTGGGILAIILGSVYIIRTILCIVAYFVEESTLNDITFITTLVYFAATCITVPIVFRKKQFNASSNDEDNEDDDFALPEI